MPTGLVKSTIHAPAAARCRTVSAISRTRGTVRSALAKPPAPVVSCPTSPKRPGMVSSRSRACWPPTLSWIRTASAPSTASASDVVVPHQPGIVLFAQDPCGQAAHQGQPVAVDVVQHQLRAAQPVGPCRESLDQFRGVGAACPDHGDLHAAILPEFARRSYHVSAAGPLLRQRCGLRRACGRSGRAGRAISRGWRTPRGGPISPGGPSPGPTPVRRPRPPGRPRRAAGTGRRSARTLDRASPR